MTLHTKRLVLVEARWEEGRKNPWQQRRLATCSVPHTRHWTVHRESGTVLCFLHKSTRSKIKSGGHIQICNILNIWSLHFIFTPMLWNKSVRSKVNFDWTSHLTWWQYIIYLYPHYLYLHNICMLATMESNNQCFDHSDSIFQINNKNVKYSPIVPVSVTLRQPLLQLWHLK